MDIFDLILTMTPGVGSVTTARLIDACFSAERVFSLSTEELVYKYKVSHKAAEAIKGRVATRSAEEELLYCERHDLTPICRVDPEYPPSLRGIKDPPHVLFVKGDKSLFTRNLISMVGTRKAGNYGMLATNRLVEGISTAVHNPVIVSGLAFGADSFAHRAALSYGVPTVAVLPSPLPNILPPSHRDLSEKILSEGGALVSELTSRQTGAGRAYLSRNRIIAGMSQGTLLIESGLSGGAMKTMQMVGEMQHHQMAFPGRLGDEMSAGCNRLISVGDASLITSVDDLIRVLGWKSRRQIYRVPEDLDTVSRVGEGDSGGSDGFDYSQLTESHRALLLSMETTEPMHVSKLESLNPMAAHAFNGMLIELELLGAINSMPGSLYQRALPMGGLKSVR